MKITDRDRFDEVLEGLGEVVERRTRVVDWNDYADKNEYYRDKRLAERIAAIPKDRVCPSCKRLVPGPRSWSMKEGVCRACLFFPFVKPDIEKLIKARRTLYHINSAKLRLVRADRSLRSFGDEAGYSGMTIHRFENEEAWIEVPGIIPVDGSKREYRLDWHVLREVAGFVSPGVLMEELDWKFDKLKKYCRPNRRWVKGTVLTIITHVVHKSCL